MALKYKRVLLKLSGESLSGKAGHGIDSRHGPGDLQAHQGDRGHGRRGGHRGGRRQLLAGCSSGKMDRTRADHMGMLATVINALGVADGLAAGPGCAGADRHRHAGSGRAPTSATGRCAIWKKGESGGVRLRHGQPPSFPRTPALTLRAAEIEADVILKATMVDYASMTATPKKNPDAKKYDTPQLHGRAQPELGCDGYDRCLLL